MHCPYCNATDTKVVDSRVVAEGTQIRRRRCCEQCGQRFTTLETQQLKLPMVVKSDGKREAFSEDKLRRGMRHALSNRPVSTEAIDDAVAHILRTAQASGASELPSRQLGHWVMEALKKLDLVAYLRFASVYLRFDDLEEFRRQIEQLEEEMQRQADAQLSLLDHD